METRKGVEHFKVKWADIAEDGATWEPASHFNGDPAKGALAEFRQRRAAEMQRHEEELAARRRGKTPTTTAPSQATTEDDGFEIVASSSNPSAKEKLAFRRKQSGVWKYYEKKRNVTTLGGTYARCKLCKKDIKCSNTTNLWAHFNNAHPEEAINGKQKAGEVGHASAFVCFTESIVECC